MDGTASTRKNSTKISEQMCIILYTCEEDTIDTVFFSQFARYVPQTSFTTMGEISVNISLNSPLGHDHEFPWS